MRGFPARRRVTAAAHTTDRHRRKKSRLHRTSHTDLEGADAEPVTRAPHTPLRAFPVRKNTQTLAGESSAISLLPHRIPFPRRAHRELPGLRRATHTSLQHAGSLPSHTGTRRRVDRRLRTRQRPQDATPHDPTPRSESPRKNALPRRGVIPSSAANAWSTPRWSRGKPRGLPTQPPPRRASPTSEPDPFPAMRASPKCFPQRT